MQAICNFTCHFRNCLMNPWYVRSGSSSQRRIFPASFAACVKRSFSPVQTSTLPINAARRRVYGGSERLRSPDQTPDGIVSTCRIDRAAMAMRSLIRIGLLR